MKCPECKTTITQKHYDVEFEWYECPKCEGAFTFDEIEAAATPSTGVVAKGKKLRADRDADANLENEMLAATVKTTRKAAGSDVQRHRDELPTGQVVNIMADEIQEIYHMMGTEIDETNARDKALILWRELVVHGHVTAREQSVPMKLCGEHA